MKTKTRGTFDCPICGVNTPHPHSAEEVSKNRAEQAAYFEMLNAPIEVVHFHFPGYGSSPVWGTRLVWNNKELEKIQSGSEYDVGFRTAQALFSWQAIQKKGKLEQASAKKPLAFQLCQCCHQPMRDGCHSQYDYTVCSEACREVMEHAYHMKRGVKECKNHFERSDRDSHHRATMRCCDCGLYWSPLNGKQLLERQYRHWD